MGSLLTAVTLLCLVAGGGVAALGPLRALVLPIDEDILPGDEALAMHGRAPLEDSVRVVCHPTPRFQHRGGPAPGADAL